MSRDIIFLQQYLFHYIISDIDLVIIFITEVREHTNSYTKMYLHTASPINSYLYNTTIPINCPTFSKILKIFVRGDQMFVIFSSPIPFSSNQSKRFDIKVLTGLYQLDTIVDDKFTYYDTIRTENSDRIEYYSIFYQEIKSLEELRDGKIDEIIP